MGRKKYPAALNPTSDAYFWFAVKYLKFALKHQELLDTWLAELLIQYIQLYAPWFTVAALEEGES